MSAQPNLNEEVTSEKPDGVGTVEGINPLHAVADALNDLIKQITRASRTSQKTIIQSAGGAVGIALGLGCGIVLTSAFALPIGIASLVMLAPIAALGLTGTAVSYPFYRRWERSLVATEGKSTAERIVDQIALLRELATQMLATIKESPLSEQQKQVQSEEVLKKLNRDIDRLTNQLTKETVKRSESSGITAEMLKKAAENMRKKESDATIIAEITGSSRSIGQEVSTTASLMPSSSK